MDVKEGDIAFIEGLEYGFYVKRRVNDVLELLCLSHKYKTRAHINQVEDVVKHTDKQRVSEMEDFMPRLESGRDIQTFVKQLMQDLSSDSDLIEELKKVKQVKGGFKLKGGSQVKINIKIDG